MTHAYDVGDSVKLMASFTHDDDSPADPTDIAAVVRSPAGIETPYTAADFTHPSVGEYVLIVTVTESGTWTWRVAGSGAVVAAGEGHFYVIESAF